MFYLRNIDRHAAALEEEIATLRAAIRDYDSTISSLRTEVSNRNAIISYQKEQLNERDEWNIERTAKATDKIARLEVEKAYLLATAMPVIYTPSTDPTPALKAPTEPPVDTTPGTPIPAPTLYTGSTLSEKLLDLEKFDGSRADLRRFTQQIYVKIKANDNRLPTATSRLTYIAGRLTRKAYELILLRISYSLP
jgi:hypothetical protein